MITGYYEELDVGQRFETGGRTITESDVVGFAGLSGDFHPLHMDAIYAEHGPFGARIAHGLLTIAVASGLMTLSREAIQAFYGLDKVRFLEVVRLGDTVRVKSEIVDKQPRETNGVVTVAVTVENQDNRPVLVMNMKFLVRLGAQASSAAAA
jgi:acyl dehydratase